jgi:methylase of polypeptide subunit release factors
VNAERFRPTAYTAALMLGLRPHARSGQVASALEMGTGSGVVLAELLQAGVPHAVGIELEAEAVACTLDLLAREGLQHRARVLHGNLWAPLQGERFDLIVANLPQFPVQQVLQDGRLPTWSCGGADGRALIDPFLRGLPVRLTPQGVAVMTHNVFIDLERTAQVVDGLGLSLTVTASVCVPLSPHKLAGLHPGVLARHQGHSLRSVGSYAFAEFKVLEIRHRGAPAARA